MATSTKFCQTGAGTSWTSPTNIYADDNADALNIEGQVVMNALKASNFGFAIPTGATIDNMQVIMGRYSSEFLGNVIDNSVRWTKNNTATVGSDIDAGATWTSGTETQNTLSGLGGVSWTAEDINASTFGVWIVPEGVGTDAEANVDYVKVTITYTEAAVSSKVMSFN